MVQITALGRMGNCTAPETASKNDKSLAYLLVCMLEREGFKYHLCQDDQQAKTYIEGNASTAVVVLDIALAYLDGFVLLRTMRYKIAWKSTPVITLISKSQPQEVAQCFRAGANDYLLKPFHPADLLARIHKLYPRATPAN